MGYKELRKEFRRTLRRYGSALKAVGAAYIAVFEDEDLGAARPDSAAAAEAEYLIDTYGGVYEEPDVWIAGSAFLRVAVAADHLASIASLFHAPEAGTYAVFVCARGLFEMCGIASWMLEPGISPEERLQRSINDRLTSLQGTVRFIEKGAVEDEYIRTDPVARIGEIGKQVEQMGFPLMGKGHSLFIEPGRPTFTELVDDIVIPGAYSLFSAYSHGEMWTLAHPGIPQTRDEETGQLYIRPQVTLEEYQAVAWRVLDSFSNTVERAGDHYGWDVASFREARSRAEADIKRM